MRTLSPLFHFQVEVKAIILNNPPNTTRRKKIIATVGQRVIKDKKPVSSPKKLILGGKDRFNTRANPHQKARDLTTTLLPEMAASLREE